jgi:hypothetical protein
LDGSSLDTLTGQLVLRVACSESESGPQLEALRARVTAFLEAAARGWFGGRIEAVAQAVDHRESVWRFRAHALPRAALAVLHGMLIDLAGRVISLRYWRLSANSSDSNLLDGHYAVPADEQPPFPLSWHLSDGVAPPTTVVAYFRHPIPPSARAEFAQEIGWWEELLQGGYATARDTPGSSAVGATALRWISPRCVVWSTDGLRADRRCFASLFRLLSDWGARFGIERVSVE